jgi:hypothetical protein
MSEIALIVAAQTGDLRAIQELINHGAVIDQRRSDGVTALMAAAIAGQDKAVTLLLDNGANIELRDGESRTVIKLALDNNHREIAQALVDRYPDMIVTDPRLPKGEAWLRVQFHLIADNVEDPASKPDPALLERLISQNLGPTEGRNVSHVYWEHILLRYIGDIPLDIDRNYSTLLKLSLIGTFDRILKGHEGIKESARLLNSRLPTTQYDIIGTIIKQTSNTGGWVTERWGYHDPQNNVQVIDGIDTFLIENGKITTKMINYTVEAHADARSLFEERIGLKRDV